MIAPKDEPRKRAGDRFSVYTDDATGLRWRRYCRKHRIAFSDWVRIALAHFEANCEPPKGDPDKLQRGTMLRPR